MLLTQITEMTNTQNSNVNKMTSLPNLQTAITLSKHTMDLAGEKAYKPSIDHNNVIISVDISNNTEHKKQVGRLRTIPYDKQNVDWRKNHQCLPH
jgi:hypothetical protein